MAVERQARIDEADAEWHEQTSGGLPRPVRAVAGGIAGAATVTALNEVGWRMIPHAPRMDVLGERALARTVAAAGRKPPRGRGLFRWTMVGDLVSNSAYHSLVGGTPKSTVWWRGALLGLLAGLGAAFLPKRLGLGRQPDERAPRTQALTVA